MNKFTCPRCEFPFYNALDEGFMDCPTCGFVFYTNTTEKRVKKRIKTKKPCKIINKDGGIQTAQTVDISKTGLGLIAPSSVKLMPDDTVKVVVEDLNLEQDTIIVWTRPLSKTTVRVGLKLAQTH